MLKLAISRINEWSAKWGKTVKIDNQFIGQYVYLVKDTSVAGRIPIDPYLAAMPCKICLEYIPWAEPNQKDGSFLCWVCRNTRQVD